MTNQVIPAAVSGIIAPAGSWADRFQNYAVAVAEKVEASAEGLGSWIGTKGGFLSYKGTPVQGNALDVIVVDFVRENQYYQNSYNSDRAESPVCYAFGDTEATMEVHAASQIPQNPNGKGCSDCPKNQFGSAENGKGKACKNVLRLGLLPASPCTADYLSTAEPAWLKVPVMSVKNFMAHISSIAALHKRPPWGVITRIGTKPDKKAQFVLTFEIAGLLPEDDALMTTMEARYNQIFDMIQFPHKANDLSAAASQSAVAAALAARMK